ncbi:hypothetical protein ACR79N_00555 [Sphingobacterium siyangense]|uniref:Uncharacterized protein n=1 Tax=Sphingobacterium siyangense TaxID=459529 RepID=A0A562M1X3_9SPHI|nr:hypothetical protein [Sphingobacterium siyangense]TWI13919.1 hypothetical protein IQ31_05468 [Sphingobacterium siyangense]
MKIKKVLLIVLGLPLFGKAQTNSFPASGNVGVGTITPLVGTNNSGVQIAKGDHSSILLGDPLGSGYGGIVQTSDTKHRLFLGANLYDDVNKGWSRFVAGKGTAGISIVADKGGWGSSISFYLSDNDLDMASKFTIRSNGNVGIGIEYPNEKLAVRGTIRAQEIKVETANWPDYVFTDGYQLPSLKETAEFIEKNKHLPGVPKAAVVEENGLSLGEMNRILMQKIEELTLHLIEKDKDISIIKTELSNLKRQINEKNENL